MSSFEDMVPRKSVSFILIEIHSQNWLQKNSERRPDGRRSPGIAGALLAKSNEKFSPTAQSPAGSIRNHSPGLHWPGKVTGGGSGLGGCNVDFKVKDTIRAVRRLFAESGKLSSRHVNRNTVIQIKNQTFPLDSD